MRGTISTFDIDAVLRQIASHQLGLVTASQAAEVGVDRFALRRRREAGALVELHPGVMRLGSALPSPPQRMLAASLSIPGSTIAATAAAVVHQLPVVSRNVRLADSPVLTVPPTSSVRRPGITCVRLGTALPSRRWMGVRLATPEAVIVLLPRFVDAFTVERCLDHCLASGLATVGAIEALVDKLPSHSVHGRTLLLDLLSQRAGGIGHRSGTEQRVGRWLTAAGLAGWERNHRVEVGNGETIEVDFAWPASRIGLEASPFFTHGSRRTQERDAFRRRLLVESDWRIVEATDPDLADQQSFGRTVRALRTLLERS